MTCSLISESHAGFTEGQLSQAMGTGFCSKSVGVPRRCLIGLSGAVHMRDREGRVWARKAFEPEQEHGAANQMPGYLSKGRSNLST